MINQVLGVQFERVCLMAERAQDAAELKKLLADIPVDTQMRQPRYITVAEKFAMDGRDEVVNRLIECGAAKNAVVRGYARSNRLATCQQYIQKYNDFSLVSGMVQGMAANNQHTWGDMVERLVLRIPADKQAQLRSSLNTAAAMGYAEAGNDEKVQELRTNENIGAIARTIVLCGHTEQIKAYKQQYAKNNRVLQGMINAYFQRGLLSEAKAFQEEMQLPLAWMAGLCAQYGYHQQVKAYLKNDKDDSIIGQVLVGYVVAKNHDRVKKMLGKKLVTPLTVAKTYLTYNQHDQVVAYCQQYPTLVNPIISRYLAGNQQAELKQLGEKIPTSRDAITYAYAEKGEDVQVASYLSQGASVIAAMAGYIKANQHETAKAYYERGQATLFELLRAFAREGMPMNSPVVQQCQSSDGFGINTLLLAYVAENRINVVNDAVGAVVRTAKGHYINFFQVAFAAAKAGHRDMIRQLYFHQSFASNTGNAIAWGAAAGGHLDLVQLAHNGKQNGGAISAHEVAYYYARANNHDLVMKYIQQHGASITAIARGYAEAGDDQRVVAYLQEGVSPNAIVYAYARVGRDDKVQELIGKGASAIEAARGYAEAGNDTMVTKYAGEWPQHGRIDDWQQIARGYAKSGNLVLINRLQQHANSQPVGSAIRKAVAVALLEAGYAKGILACGLSKLETICAYIRGGFFTQAENVIQNQRKSRLTDSELCEIARCYAEAGCFNKATRYQTDILNTNMLTAIACGYVDGGYHEKLRALLVAEKTPAETVKAVFRAYQNKSYDRETYRWLRLRFPEVLDAPVTVASLLVDFRQKSGLKHLADAACSSAKRHQVAAAAAESGNGSAAAPAAAQ